MAVAHIDVTTVIETKWLTPYHARVLIKACTVSGGRANKTVGDLDLRASASGNARQRRYARRLLQRRIDALTAPEPLRLRVRLQTSRPYGV